MGSVFVTAAHMSISLRECIHMAHRFVQLSGHVRSEYALHGQSCSLLAPVTRLLNIHALVLLDDDCGPCATQELCKTENRKQCTWSTYGQVLLQHLMAGPPTMTPLTSGPGIHGRISG